MKLVINVCYGGYGLSEEAEALLGGEEEAYEYERSDEKLIKVVEELGVEKASGDYAELKVVELPENTTDYYINKYDGLESVLYVVDGKIHWAL